MPNNPNDISAKYYDFYTAPLKGETITAKEIALITRLLPGKGKILDVGCGTGRHLLKLADLGYQITGIDSSRGMLKNLENKLKTVKSKKILKNITIIYGDILQKKIRLPKFDLIILFWNTFNEIALTKGAALSLLCKLKQILDRQGSILLNLDNPQLLSLPDLHFTTRYTLNNKTYVQHWQVEKFSGAGKITKSAETIQVFTNKGHLLEETEALITQRWWGKRDLADLCKKLNLKSEFITLPDTEEFYIVLSKK